MKIIKKHSSIFLLVLVLIFFSFFSQLKVSAQQTLITVPYPDVAAPGSIGLKESNRFRPFNPGEYVILSPIVIYGIGHNAEISTGVNTSIAKETDVKLDLYARKYFPLTNSTRLTIGTRLSPNLSESSTPFNFNFAHVSQRINKTGTMFLGGVYIANGKEFLPDRVGALLGFEQNIKSDKFKVVADWISRNESYGYIGAGIKYKPVKTLSITNAILIPNGKRAKLAFVISITKWLPNTKQKKIS